MEVPNWLAVIATIWLLANQTLKIILENKTPKKKKKK